MWRTTHDIADDYNTSDRSMLDVFHQNIKLAPYAGPSGWNDAEVLEVGNGGMTATEDRTQFTLWAEMAAPLIAGNDLSTMSQATRRILTNREVIAVDQDPLGKQGYAVASADGHWVLTKPLTDGDRAVVLFNETDKPARIRTTAQAVGMPAARGYLVKDLWKHDSTRTGGALSADVPPHAAEMYLVKAVGRSS